MTDGSASIHHIEHRMQQGYADATALVGGNVEAMVRSSQAWMGGLQAVNGEMLAFCQSRMKENLATSQRLAECRSPESAIEVQMEYAKAILQSYAHECEKLGELAGKVMSDALTPLKGRGHAVAEMTAKNLAA